MLFNCSAFLISRVVACPAIDGATRALSLCLENLVYIELCLRGQQRIGSPGGLGNFRPPSSLLTLPPYYTQSGFTKTAAKFSACFGNFCDIFWYLIFGQK